MEAVAALTPEAVQSKYHLPSVTEATALWLRAKDISSRGFEWALLHGKPRNPSAKIYKALPPCCQLESVGGRWRCADNDWKASLNTSLPIGDPFYGFEWKKNRTDPGTYVGGTELR